MVRQTVAPAFVISMAVGVMLMSGSGFTAWAGVGYDLGLGGPVEDLESQAAEDPESSSIVDTQDLLGMAISGLNIVVETFIWVYLFPLALMNVGFPGWFATPVGLPVLYINLIGTAELLRGMNIR